jgi:hypothetical protein
MDGAMDEAWRAQRDAATRLTQLWADLLESGTRSASQPLVAAGSDAMNAMIRGAAEYATAAVQPVRDLIQGQRDFADQVSRWADMQREIAENMSSWAARQREYVDALDRLLPPFSPQMNRPAG